jgi:hypothetical protein
VIPLSLLPAAGHEIYATDGCVDPGLVGPDVVIQAATIAPVLSPRVIALLVGLLVAVGVRRLYLRVN